MRVLVTGAAGFVGSHLCETLVASGHQVVGLDAFVGWYDRPIKERNLGAVRSSDRFSLVECDLRSGALEPVLDGVDAVINEAAMAGLVRSWSEIQTYADANVIGLARLLDACRARGVGRFLQISTSSVYGLNAVGDETLPTRPASPYGVTKLAAEHLVLAYAAAYGIDVSILRYFSIYGPRQRPDMAYHRFIEAMRRSDPVVVYGDGAQTRSNTYVSDCVRGTLLALEGAAPGEAYNIGGGAVITINEAIEVIAAALGVDPRIEHAPQPPGDQLHTAADISKAERSFGYQPTVHPRDGLRRQVEWHLETIAAP